MAVDRRVSDQSNRAMKSKSEGIQTIQKNLSKLGITKKYLETVVLPDWWDDEILKTGSGVQEYLIHISRNLGISIKELRSESINIEEFTIPLQYKMLRNQKVDKFRIYKSLCLDVSEKLLSISKPELKIPKSAEEVRKILIQSNSIQLDHLLDYLKECGILVLPPFRLPSKSSAPQGMVFLSEDIPVISLGEKRKYPSYQTFTLLHELGHIVCGHLQKEPIWDFKIRKELENQIEIDANRFAMEVLTGEPNFSVQLNAKQNPENFAESCKMEGKNRNINPEYLAINFAWSNANHDYWSLANAALKIMEKPNALEILQHKFTNIINSLEISDSYNDYLKRITSFE